MAITALDVAVCVCVAALVYGLLALRSKRRLPYPPGPPGYPIIGNLAFPDDPLWVKVKAMSEEYGSDVIRFRMVGNNIIFLNSYEAATELMDKRSTIYSDRPSAGMVMLRELVGMGWSFGLKQYGSEWRDGRKAFHHEFRPQTVHKFRPAETKGAHMFLRSLLQSPENFVDHCRHLAGRIIMDVAYGIDVQEKDDPWINTAEHALEGVTRVGIPGTFMVDFIPILKYVPEWVPGAGFQKIAREYRKSAMSVLNDPFQLVKDQMVQGHSGSLRTSAAKSLIEDVINKSTNVEYTEKVVKAAVASMYAAGSDTVGASLQTFILAMVLHPEVQQKAQAEIDTVCGGRLPDFSDYDRLPYVHAAVKESMRWIPVVMLNLAHRLMKDDQYKGYHIPSGSIVIVNNWALLHNPEMYPDPDRYNPDRFVKTNPDDSQVLDPEVQDPHATGVFGWGRRICPGRQMAYEALWIAAATMLATFDISRAKDEKGEYITPEVNIASGLINHVMAFPCEILPRSADHRDLVLSGEV